jgi:hypothetical protein
MGKVKLGNELNIENVLLGTGQVSKIMMGTVQIFPDCTLDVIGWDNSGTWVPVTLYSHVEESQYTTTQLNLFHNNIGGALIVGAVVSESNTGIPVFNGSGLFITDQSSYYTSGTSYVINSVGVVTAINEWVT